MTIDTELRDLAIYLKNCDSDSAAAVCERAREVIAELYVAVRIADKFLGMGCPPESLSATQRHLNNALAASKANR